MTTGLCECVGHYKRLPLTAGIFYPAAEDDTYHYADPDNSFCFYHNGRQRPPFTHIKANVPQGIKNFLRPGAIAHMLAISAECWAEGSGNPIAGAKGMHFGIGFNVSFDDNGNIFVDVLDLGITSTDFYIDFMARPSSPLRDRLLLETHWDYSQSLEEQRKKHLN